MTASGCGTCGAMLGPATSHHAPPASPGRGGPAPVGQSSHWTSTSQALVQRVEGELDRLGFYPARASAGRSCRTWASPCADAVPCPGMRTVATTVSLCTSNPATLHDRVHVVFPRSGSTSRTKPRGPVIQESGVRARSSSSTFLRPPHHTYSRALGRQETPVSAGPGPHRSHPQRDTRQGGRRTYSRPSNCSTSTRKAPMSSKLRPGANSTSRPMPLSGGLHPAPQTRTPARRQRHARQMRSISPRRARNAESKLAPAD
jgi:hypothetical protein